MLRVLFVDDDPGVLDGLRRALHIRRCQWETSFAGSAQEALRVLERTPHDVIVSDMRMPGMDGGDLLAEVQRRHPHTLRIILSGYSDRQMILKTVLPAHQFVSKPCDAGELEEIVEQAMRLRHVLENERVRHLLAGGAALPTVPEVFEELERELRSPSPSLDHIGELIERDTGLTASLLRLVNSSFFGLRRHVSGPHQAVVLLGTETVKSLVLGLELTKRFRPPEGLAVNLHYLWRHGTHVGHFSRMLALQMGATREVADHAFIAGLLHDVGKLVLLSHLSAEYAEVLRKVREEELTLPEAEFSVLHTTHAEIGAYLLALWGLPVPVVEAVLGHHFPSRPPESGHAVHVGETCPTCPPPVFGATDIPLAAVHLGNVLEHDLIVLHSHYRRPKADSAFLARTGLAGKMEGMRAACRKLMADAGVETNAAEGEKAEDCSSPHGCDEDASPA